MMKEKCRQPTGQDICGINLKRSLPIKQGHTFLRTKRLWWTRAIFLGEPGCSLPGLGTVQRRGDQVSPAVSVEDQGLAARQHPAAKADLGPSERGEAVVGGEARAGEAF